MTVIFENESSMHMRKIYKTGSQRDKMILNCRISNLRNGYFAVEGQIVPLRDIGDKREFNALLKTIDKRLKFSGTNTDYNIFRKSTGI